MKLSERLRAVASFVPADSVLADIGSDHAYLPIYLVKKGQIRRAVAGEVVKGPYESAVRNVKKEGLEDAVAVRLANGLQAVKEEDRVTCVTIAGMGGPLIASILREGENRLAHVSRIIAQPNIHAASIREWAIEKGWYIVDEAIIQEDGKIYELIVLERGSANYTEEELQFGPFLMKQRNSVFIEKMENELSGKERILRSLSEAEQSEDIMLKKAAVESQITLIRKVLSV